MIVRGWLMIGEVEASLGLPPEWNRGWWLTVPPASAHEVGEWVIWNTSPLAVCLVCVEVPIG